MSIPISVGSGAASVAAEAVGGLQYQQIEVLGKGGASTLGINPDGSINVSILGTIPITGSVTAISTGSVVAVIPGSVITVWQSSSVIARVTGSVVSIPSGNQSVSGTVGASIIGNAPVIIYGPGGGSGAAVGDTTVDGYNPANPGLFTLGFPYVFNGTYWDRQRGDSSIGALVSTGKSSVITVAQGSVAAVIVGGSIAASFTPPANQSVSGTTGASIIGWVPVQVSNTSVITVWQNSSVIAVPTGNQSVSGTVNAVVTGTVATLDNHSEDAANVSGDIGSFALGVRNDTLASVTGSDGDYTQITVGPAGENITANAPLTKWVQGTADFRQGNTGASIVVIAAQGASIFTYITAVQVANMGSASVLVTLAGTGSTLGYTIAPAGGGSNIYYPNALKTPANATFAASISGISSVLVSAQGFIAKI